MPEKGRCEASPRRKEAAGHVGWRQEEAGGATSLVWAVECLAEELLREASLELKVQQAG